MAPKTGVRQLQTADLQTRAWVNQTRTSVSQTSASYRYRYIGIGIYIVYLTNRFHVAVRLFSNRSQMTSKCGKNKKVAHEA